MTKNGKRELLEAIRPRYLRASTTEKTHILDESVAITGYHRNMPFASWTAYGHACPSLCWASIRTTTPMPIAPLALGGR